ncbi:hypothetical protein HRbin15_01498 [bacterium HR15]|nr:hypothetical protein HRbin15_01498 [bacterium HR15]
MTRRRLYYIGLFAGLCLLPLGLLLLWLWISFVRADTMKELRHDFDVDPSGHLFLFNSKAQNHDLIFIFDNRSKQFRKLANTFGSVEEICFLTQKEAVVCIRTKPNRYSADVHLYLLDLETGKMRCFASPKAVSGIDIIRIDAKKFMFKRYQPRVYLTLFGWEIYALVGGDFLADLEHEDIIPVEIATGFYEIEQVLDDTRKVIISRAISTKGKSWFVAELDRDIGDPNPQIKRMQRLPVVTDMLLASDDGRFCYYVIHNAAINRFDILKMDVNSQHAQVLGSFKHPVKRLRWSRGRLFILMEAERPSIWRVGDGREAPQKVFDIFDDRN